MLNYDGIVRFGHKDLYALIKGADFIQAKFPDKDLLKGQHGYGFELVAGYRRVIRDKKGNRQGERNEWHRVLIGDLSHEVPPAHYFHLSYGQEWIKTLLLHEVKERGKHPSTPYFYATPAYWGHGTRKATFKIEAGPSWEGDTDPAKELTGDCYNVYVGESYLTIAGFTVEPANKWGGRCIWREKQDPSEGDFVYRFDPFFDQNNPRKSK